MATIPDRAKLLAVQGLVLITDQGPVPIRSQDVRERRIVLRAGDTLRLTYEIDFVKMEEANAN